MADSIFPISDVHARSDRPHNFMGTCVYLYIFINLLQRTNMVAIRAVSFVVKLRSVSQYGGSLFKLTDNKKDGESRLNSYMLPSFLRLSAVLQLNLKVPQMCRLHMKYATKRRVLAKLHLQCGVFQR